MREKLVKITLRKSLDSEDGELGFRVNLRAWDGLDIAKLPYFGTISQLAEKLSAGWLLGLTVEIDGNAVMGVEGFSLNAGPYLSDVRVLLEHLGRLATITKLVQQRLVFHLDSAILASDFERVREIFDIANGQFCLTLAELTKNPTFKLTGRLVNPDLITLARSVAPKTFRLEYPVGETLTVFGQQLVLPRKAITMRSVEFVPSVPLSEVSADDVFGVELVPCDGFRCEIEYIQ